MIELLYAIIEGISRIHSWILSLNDSYELYFTDKELHFLIIGILGMGLIFLIHPIFNWLSKNNHVMVITWLYVFTIILVLTFAIEIGQRVSGSGRMEFADIMFGLAGFLVFFVVFAILRAIVKAIVASFKK